MLFTNRTVIRARAGQCLATAGLVAGIALGATTPIATAAPVTAEDLNNCTANGGDKVLCCARYGGDYTQDAPSTPKPGVVVTSESCIFPNGARVAFLAPPVQPSNPPPKAPLTIAPVPAAPRAAG
jgi:hypothetical protein